MGWGEGPLPKGHGLGRVGEQFLSALKEGMVADKGRTPDPSRHEGGPGGQPRGWGWAGTR